MRMRASAAPVVDVTAARASAGTTCPKRRLTQGCAFLRKLNLFFFPCSLIVALRSPRRRRQVLAPLFLYLYFRVSPDRTRALPPCAQFRRPTTARADATPAALRRLINTRSRCRCARSASELPRTAHSVAADDDARQGPDLLLLDAEERSVRWLGACGVAEDRSPSLPPSDSPPPAAAASPSPPPSTTCGWRRLSGLDGRRPPPRRAPRSTAGTLALLSLLRGAGTRSTAAL